MVTKYCHRCKLDKQFADFSPDPRGRNGLDNQCRDCRNVSSKKMREENPEFRKGRREYMQKWRKENLIKYEYGITNDQYSEMVTMQGNKCAICGSDNPKAPRWCIDHDHESDKVRGLLCHACNTALGGYEKMMRIAGHLHLDNYLHGIKE